MDFQIKIVGGFELVLGLAAGAIAFGYLPVETDLLATLVMIDKALTGGKHLVTPPNGAPPPQRPS